MIQFEITVKSKEGIHARPAMQLAMKAKSFPDQIRISYQGKEVNAKNVMALLTLRAFCGAKVKFTVTGNTEEETSVALREYCERNL